MIGRRRGAPMTPTECERLYVGRVRHPEQPEPRAMYGPMLRRFEAIYERELPHLNGQGRQMFSMVLQALRKEAR